MYYVYCMPTPTTALYTLYSYTYYACPSHSKGHNSDND